MKKILLLALLAVFASSLIAQELTYCRWEGPERTRTDRVMRSFNVFGGTLNGISKDFKSTLFPSLSEAKVNVDRTKEIITVTQGDVLSVKMAHSVAWMHFYLYIDYNHDGMFNTENEMVSYTYINDKTSTGETVSDGYCPQDMPIFKIPEDVMVGSTRLRLKIDWDNSNPCPPVSNGLGMNGGILLDYTININPLPASFPVKIGEADNGTIKIFDKSENEISDGQLVDRKSVLKVKTIPADGYKLVNLMLNNRILDVDTFIVTRPDTITATFIEKDKYTLSWTVQANGTVSIVPVEGVQTPIVNGDFIPSMKKYKLTVTPNESYAISLVEIDGKDLTLALNESGVYEFMMPAAAKNIKVEFAKGLQLPTYSAPTGNMHVNGETYVKNISVNGTDTQINYQATKAPETLLTVLDGKITAKRGDTFTIHLIANKLGEYSEETVLQDLRYDVACISVDWNRDGKFTKAESARLAGKISGEEGFQAIGGNMDVLDITTGIKIPLTASVGDMRVRVYYTKASASNPLNTPNAVVDGVIYEFVLAVQDISYPVVFNTLSKGGSFLLTNRGLKLNSGAKVLMKSKLLIEHTIDKGYQIKSMTLNKKPLLENSFVVDTISTLFVEYTDSMKVNYALNEGGLFSVKKANGTVVNNNDWINVNEKLTYSVSPSEGYKIESLTLNGEDAATLFSNGTYTADLVKNMAFDIKFVKQSFPLTYTITGNGEASVKIAGLSVASGTTVNYWDVIKADLTPIRFYEIGSIIINGKDMTKELLNGTTSFTLDVKSAVDMKINFVAQQFNLKYVAKGNGKVTLLSYTDDSEIPTGSKVNAKETITIVATPGKDEKLISLMINGEDWTEEVFENMLDMQVIDDIDILVTFSGVTSIRSESLSNLSVYPTMFHSSITIESANENDVVCIYDAVGKCIKKLVVPTSGDLVVSASDMPNGPYYIKVLSGTSSKSFKTIKY